MIGRRLVTCLVAVIVSSSAVAAPITFNTALPVGDRQIIVREQFIATNSGDDPAGLGRELNTRSLTSVVAYGINARLAMFGVLPYTHKDSAALGEADRSNDGFGDVTVFGRFTLHQRDWPGRTLRVAGVGGIKAPTGSDNDSDQFGVLPAGLQAGTGSWDSFVGAVVSYQTIDFGIDAQLSYRENTQANNFEAGDVWRMDLSWQHRLRPRVLTAETRSFLFGVVELNTIVSERSRRFGDSIRDSGGTIVFLTPGIQYATRKLIAEVALQIPLTQNLNGLAVENDFVLRGGFRIHF